MSVSSVCFKHFLDQSVGADGVVFDEQPVVQENRCVVLMTLSIGNLSLTVIVLRCRYATHKRIEPSFFFTRTTGAEYGLLLYLATHLYQGSLWDFHLRATCILSDLCSAWPFLRYETQSRLCADAMMLSDW
ncbi:hypothetical protein Pelo_7165 [Pelomyxa schiedti]|nr:hypothetical protein Pelo_7165 [Pelomyxa schiedti]